MLAVRDVTPERARLEARTAEEAVAQVRALLADPDEVIRPLTHER